MLPASPAVTSDNADIASSRVKIKYEFHRYKKRKKFSKLNERVLINARINPFYPPSIFIFSKTFLHNTFNIKSVRLIISSNQLPSLILFISINSTKILLQFKFAFIRISNKHFET